MAESGRESGPETDCDDDQPALAAPGHITAMATAIVQRRSPFRILTARKGDTKGGRTRR
jgi:hypothetical protein